MDGSWVCLLCSSINMRRAEVCYRCGSAPGGPEQVLEPIAPAPAGPRDRGRVVSLLSFLPLVLGVTLIGAAFAGFVVVPIVQDAARGPAPGHVSFSPSHFGCDSVRYITLIAELPESVGPDTTYFDLGFQSKAYPVTLGRYWRKAGEGIWMSAEVNVALCGLTSFASGEHRYWIGDTTGTIWAEGTFTIDP